MTRGETWKSFPCPLHLFHHIHDPPVPGEGHRLPAQLTAKEKSPSLHGIYWGNMPCEDLSLKLGISNWLEDMIKSQWMFEWVAWNVNGPKEDIWGRTFGRYHCISHSQTRGLPRCIVWELNVICFPQERMRDCYTLRILRNLRSVIIMS